MPGIATNSEPGIARAVATPPRKGTSGSSVPWITVVGTRSRRSCGVRSPDARTAASWRAVPAGAWLRSKVAAASSRIRGSSIGKPGEPIILKVRTKYSTKSSRRCGARRMSRLQVRSFGMPARRSPVVDMIEVSDSTRSGCSMAIVCPIMPPIDTPITWVRSIPSASSSPNVSAAMSVSR